MCLHSVNLFLVRHDRLKLHLVLVNRQRHFGNLYRCRESILLRAIVRYMPCGL